VVALVRRGAAGERSMRRGESSREKTGVEKKRKIIKNKIGENAEKVKMREIEYQN